jgi:hypothetical protein
VTTVADSIEEIARSERAHVGRLGRMRDNARIADSTTSPLPDRER